MGEYTIIFHALFVFLNVFTLTEFAVNKQNSSIYGIWVLPCLFILIWIFFVANKYVWSYADVLRAADKKNSNKPANFE